MIEGACRNDSARGRRGTRLSQRRPRCYRQAWPEGFNEDQAQPFAAVRLLRIPALVGQQPKQSRVHRDHAQPCRDLGKAFLPFVRFQVDPIDPAGESAGLTESLRVKRQLVIHCGASMVIAGSSKRE